MRAIVNVLIFVLWIRDTLATSVTLTENLQNQIAKEGIRINLVQAEISSMTSAVVSTYSLDRQKRHIRLHYRPYFWLHYRLFQPASAES